MAARESIVIADSSTKCKKCLNHYDDPRMLPCLHSFCKSCVGQLVIQTGSKKTVRCPTCYSTTPFPLKGVEVFPRNVRLSYEATITKYEAQIKSETPPSCDECRREPPLETVSFCFTCRSFLCKECHAQHTLSRKAWVYHKIIILKQASNVQSALRQNTLQPPIACSQHPDKNIEFFCIGCSVLVCMQCALIQHRGHKLEELNKLSQKKRAKIKESVQTMPDSIAKLEETLAKGMSTKKELKASKEAVDDKIRKAFNEMREELDKREKDLLAKCSEISIAKETNLALQLEELTSLKDQMVACTAYVDEVQESYSDTELLSVVTTLQTRVQKLTWQFDKTPLKLREDKTISLTIDTTVQGCEISKLGTFRRHQPRDYKSLKDPVISISSYTPMHVAVHDNGDILVSDHNSHHIHVYDKDGVKKATYGSQGTGNGQFTNPAGIAVVGDIMFVSDYNGNRVQKLTTGGQFLSKFGAKRQLDGPHGCAVSSDGKIYIADQNNHSVKVFNPDGLLSRTIGEGQLNKPRAVAIDSSGNIHVASLGLKSIKVYTPSGELVREYGGEQLKGPSGIAVDEDNYCLVGDRDGHSLWIFDPQGKQVHSINFPGRVYGVTLDKDGFVYVAEYGSNKVHKY